MPPKQATRTAPPKGYAYASEDEFETLLDKSPGISLPAVPTAPNWNYGGPSSIALPKSSPVNPTMSYQRIAQRIQIGKEMAEKRDSPRSRDIEQDDQSPVQRQPRTRTRREPAADSGSPIRRRTKREPTPDQTQLLQSLRQATASPTREGTNQPSDATPSPPVPHPVSTDSEPDAQPPRQRRLSMVEVSQLYPSPLQRVGDHREAPVGSTPDRQGSVDNASEVSWNLERDIHEDNLQRTRPSKYRGRNITKPPRRPSGLAIVQETIEEEEEPTSVPVVEPVVEAAPDTWTAPARTIIPQIFRRSRSPENITGRISPKDGLVERWLSSLRPESRDGRPLEPKSRANWVRVAVLLLLSLLLVFSFQSGYLEKLRFSFPLKESSLQLPPNITESEIFYGLRNQVSRANAQISSLSREISSVRSEHAKHPPPTLIADPLAAPKPSPKINFLSPQLGAIVDFRNSTPTVGRVPSWTEYLLAKLSVGGGISARGPLPPAAALTHWEDVGDCWCTTPRDGVSQLSVSLNYYVVPEEVVVEHIPTGATPNPGVAPKNIEMWARFRIVPMDKGKSSSEATRAIGPSAPGKGLGPYNIPGEATLHDVLMSSLRVSHPYEDESAYSDDPLLGPNFYRVGKMKYDINKENHVQRFSLNTIVDVPTIRVDKVVFRFTSNWGSNHTCIYRLRLHGHV